MKLSKEEMETVIIFNEADKTAHIETYNGRLQRRIKELAAERPDECVIESEQDGVLNCVFPKKWVKINAPRILTEEEREKLSNHAREIFGHLPR